MSELAFNPPQQTNDTQSITNHIKKKKMPSKAMKAWRKITSSKPIKRFVGGLYKIARRGGGAAERLATKGIGIAENLGSAALDKAGAMGNAKVAGMKKGGVTKGDGIKRLHKGELVIPHSTTKKLRNLLAKRV